MTKDFCFRYLNEKQEELCKKPIEKMAHKQTVPFVSARLEIWAASIIHTLGGIRFLFDKEL